MSKRKLMHDLVEIHVDTTPEATTSGIQLMKKKAYGYLDGIVKAVGVDVKEVEEGDKVRFLPYGYSPQQDEDGSLTEVESTEVTLHIYIVHEPSIILKFVEND